MPARLALSAIPIGGQSAGVEDHPPAWSAAGCVLLSCATVHLLIPAYWYVRLYRETEAKHASKTRFCLSVEVITASHAVEVLVPVMCTSSEVLNAMTGRSTR